MSWGQIFTLHPLFSPYLPIFMMQSSNALSHMLATKLLWLLQQLLQPILYGNLGSSVMLELGVRRNLLLQDCWMFLGATTDVDSTTTMTATDVNSTTTVTFLMRPGSLLHTVPIRSVVGIGNGEQAALTERNSSLSRSGHLQPRESTSADCYLQGRLLPHRGLHRCHVRAVLLANRFEFYGIEKRYWVTAALYAVTKEIKEQFIRMCKAANNLLPMPLEGYTEHLARAEVDFYGALPNDHPMSWYVFTIWLNAEISDLGPDKAITVCPASPADAWADDNEFQRAL